MDDIIEITVDDINTLDTLENKEINYETLINERKQHMFDKLDKIYRVNIIFNEQIKTIYKMADLINLTSYSKHRDYNLMLKYSNCISHDILINNAIRTCCFLDIEGIKFYLYNGKVSNYIDACKYFNIPCINLKYLKYDKELENIQNGSSDSLNKSQYETNKILRWLFNKRKSNQSLGNYTNIRKLIDTYKDNMEIKEKIDYLIDKIKY